MNWLFIEINPKFYSLDLGPIGSIKLACKHFNSGHTRKFILCYV